MNQSKPPLKDRLPGWFWWTPPLSLIADALAVYVFLQQQPVTGGGSAGSVTGSGTLPTGTGGLPDAFWVTGLLTGLFIASTIYYSFHISKPKNNWLLFIGALFLSLFVLFAYVRFWSAYWLGQNWWLGALMCLGLPTLIAVVFALKWIDAVISTRRIAARSGSPRLLNGAVVAPYPITIQTPVYATATTAHRRTSHYWIVEATIGLTILVALVGVIAILSNGRPSSSGTASGISSPYQYIDLSTANAFEHPEISQRFSNWPRGVVQLGKAQVPFDFGNRAMTIETQFGAELQGGRNLTADVTIPIRLDHPMKVYLLMNLSYDCLQIPILDVGSLVFNFNAGPPIEVPLRASYNIREWATEALECHQAQIMPLISATNVEEVWSGASLDKGINFGTRWVMDMFTFTVPVDRANQQLINIEIHDTSITSLGNARPAIQVFGVTVQTRQP